MSNDEEENWSREKERKEDPLKISAELLKNAREAMAVMQHKKVKSFAEVSALAKRSWEEVKCIAPDAPADVQANILFFLMGTQE